MQNLSFAFCLLTGGTFSASISEHRRFQLGRSAVLAYSVENVKYKIKYNRTEKKKPSFFEQFIFQTVNSNL